MGFKMRQRAIVAVLGVHPGVVGRVRPAIGSHDRDSGGHRWAVGRESGDVDLQQTHRLEIVSVANRQNSRSCARNVHDTDLVIARAVAQVGDSPAIRRPARSLAASRTGL